MANITVTNTFTAGTLAQSAQVNTNFTDLTTWLNARDNGSAEWQNVKITATVANPVDITGNQATTELSINNTATDGDPILSWKLSGTTKFTAGCDDGDSDFFKIGTTAIGTGTFVKYDGSTLFLGASSLTEVAATGVLVKVDLGILAVTDTTNDAVASVGYAGNVTTVFDEGSYTFDVNRGALFTVVDTNQEVVGVFVADKQGTVIEIADPTNKFTVTDVDNGDNFAVFKSTNDRTITVKNYSGTTRNLYVTVLGGVDSATNPA